VGKKEEKKEKKREKKKKKFQFLQKAITNLGPTPDPSSDEHLLITARS